MSIRIVCDQCEEEMTCVCNRCSAPRHTGEMTNDDWEKLHKRAGEDMATLLHKYGQGQLPWNLIQDLMKREEIAYQMGYEDAEAKQKVLNNT